MINYDSCDKYDMSTVLESLASRILHQQHDIVYEEDIFELLKEEGLDVHYYEDMEIL